MEAVRFEVGGDWLHGELHWPAAAGVGRAGPDRATGRAPRARGKGSGSTGDAAPSGMDAGVVLVHGFNSCLIEFGDAPRQLARAGFVTLAFDQRGHGGSGGERARTSLERCLEDIDGAVALLRARAGETLPLGVLGHSLGGAFALGALARTRHFRAGVVAHPVNSLWEESKWFERPLFSALARINRVASRRGKNLYAPYNVRYNDLFVSRDAARAAKRDAFIDRKANLGNYAFARSMSAAAWAQEVRVPTLVTGSPNDRVVDPAHARAVYEAVAGPKDWFGHAGGHSCFRDIDGPQVVAAAAQWFQRHLGEPRDG